MKIALGVTGGVAAYKAAELVRRLQQEKLDVQVVMTRAAQEFITPLTFAALTGKKVITEMFGADDAAPANVESAIEHIAVAQRIDLLLVAPATADILGAVRARHRRRFSLARSISPRKRPSSSRPAMNVNMWEHPATQENLATLRARGVHVVDPDEGYLACGMTGAGPPRRHGDHRRRKFSPCSACAAISRARPCSSPPAPRAKTSILCASSPTARPAKWATRSRKPPRAAART